MNSAKRILTLAGYLTIDPTVPCSCCTSLLLMPETAQRLRGHSVLGGQHPFARELHSAVWAAELLNLTKRRLALHLPKSGANHTKLSWDVHRISPLPKFRGEIWARACGWWLVGWWSERMTRVSCGSVQVRSAFTPVTSGPSKEGDHTSEWASEPT